MVKIKNIIFICSNCGAQYQKWVGRCLECGKWGTIEQQTKYLEKNTNQSEHPVARTKGLHEIEMTNVKRIMTGIGELDRVLGGGIVPGSLILLGGEPGIGKSTLALQLAASVKNTLYISGEESVEQIAMRAKRLLKLETRNLKQEEKTLASTPVSSFQFPISSLQLANETNTETICATIKKDSPPLAIIDSIQTIYSDEVAGEPGNPTQIRACAAKLLETAKTNNSLSVNQDYPLSVSPVSPAIIIIGHVTKDGSVAGPKMLEHLVDTVLYFEGDQHHNLRILRATKNRFGSTDEVGIFEMAEAGLKEVKNPSQYLLDERGENMPGSVVTCLMEGTRPLLVEVQALVSKTSFGYPVRKASGFDLNRLHVLTAVLQTRAGLNLAQYDIHLNIVGGVKADEPATDLAVCLAIASAYKNKALGADLVVFGEVGLGGEVRSVKQVERRIKECENLGMKRVITRLRSGASAKIKAADVKNIGELIKMSA
ncbi:MAG: DNA repair protein RadA [Patescibacteria group bacterium]